MKKVIIFGGCGFLGSWISKVLLQEKYDITIFDQNINKDLLNIIAKNNINKVNFVEGDITDLVQVQGVLRKADHVINLAGLMTPDCSFNPILGATVNILGSINVFEAAKKNNIKFIVYASSAGVFGIKDKFTPFPETHYGAYKLAIEGVARAYFNENQISSFGIRPYVLYGPGREVGGTAGVTLACKAAKQGLKFTINFAGRAGFVFVEDVANLVEMYLKNCPVGAITTNINGISKDVKEFISIIKKNIPAAKIGFNDKPLSVVDEILGDEPHKYFKEFKYTTLEDGIKNTIDFY
tara:strand:+ start:287 stop:1171 length:885 start_codon:yes stop_codon:yes gene_type:complete